METLKNRIVKLLDTLNERVYGKEEVMALALLSAVAGESIFLLGPPGVAKSMVARRLWQERASSCWALREWPRVW